MNPIPLLDDLKALRDQGEIPEPAAALIEQVFFEETPSLSTLAEIGAAANLCLFRALALLLKADFERHQRHDEMEEEQQLERERRKRAYFGRGGTLRAAYSGNPPLRPWQPWTESARLGDLLKRFKDCPAADRLEVLLLEQWALGAHQMDTFELRPLAERYRHSTALLDAATRAERATFIEAKGEWLRQEYQLAQLTDMRKRLSDDMERARMVFLLIVQDVYGSILDSANRLALWRYRQHFNDITMTTEEVRQRLALDYGEAESPLAAVALEPELLEVLRDRIEQLHADLNSMNQLVRLSGSGQISLASREDLQRATMLFRKLARKIHPDALCQHPQYNAISAPNKKSLSDMWVEASATHRNRVYLEPKKLINYEQNLEHCLRRADKILQHLDFHDPSKIIEGNTLEEQFACVTAAREEVERYLHAVRDDFARLQLDPQHQEHLRVISMNAHERQAERSRMAQQTRTWNTAADQIQRAMAAQAAAQSRAEANLLKRTGS